MHHSDVATPGSECRYLGHYCTLFATNKISKSKSSHFFIYLDSFQDMSEYKLNTSVHRKGRGEGRGFQLFSKGGIS